MHNARNTSGVVGREKAGKWIRRNENNIEKISLYELYWRTCYFLHDSFVDAQKSDESK